jgi:hypothetical protein
MAATLMSRLQLNQEFRDGERPSGEDFASAWLSFLNITDDGVKMDSFNNFEVARGLKLNDATNGSQGTLRFNGGQVQFHDGVNFKNISAGAGAFVPFGPGPHVFFAGGNVGIGAFGSAPTNKLEVLLGANTAADQRVKLGNFVIHNGPVANPGAYACHNNQPGDTSFALFQDSSGATTVNAAAGQQLILAQNAQNRFRALTTGDIIVSPAATKTITLAGVTGVQGNLTVFGDLTVNGHAFKPAPQAWEIPISDARVKKDIRTYSEGLEKLLALKPVTYKFNGKAGTIDDDKDYVGLVAQDVQEVFPDIILRRQVKLHEEDDEEVEMLTYDSGPLIYSIINSIKELSSRILKLEKSEKHAKRESKSTSRAHD